MTTVQPIAQRRNWDKKAEFEQLRQRFNSKFRDGYKDKRAFSFKHTIDKYHFQRLLFEGQQGYDLCAPILLGLSDQIPYNLWITGGDAGYNANRWIFRGFVERQLVYPHSTPIPPFQGKVEGMISLFIPASLPFTVRVREYEDGDLIFTP